ncbi:MAG: bifunctional 3-phenylpropionate/cinnamic acid dioxygenase ferredoxin subunit [Pseudomonadota bacterium]|nr:bifunctional 3-phenylpropionate/cinnamic acid dioxygenase ferredoxin subunit [Pseudomonadota bacterium]
MSTTPTGAAWTRVCAISELPLGEATTLKVDPPVAVFHVEGSFYAIDDTCTHETYSLAEGYIQGTQVECALHLAKFDLKTGAALCLPATVGVRTYPVKTENEQIFVDLSTRG